MTVRVLVVDDSRFFRNRLKEILSKEGHLDVVGTAENGQEAVDQVQLLKPDVITMDVEMPVMDGITAVRRIMAVRPTPILMFSTLTMEGAKATLDALDAGALDFLPKRFEDIAQKREDAHRVLCDRVRMLGTQAASAFRRHATMRSTTLNRDVSIRPATSTTSRPREGLGNARIVVIGASTGGPTALQKVLAPLPADFPLPLLVVQHMPSAFTGPYAQRLDKLCQIKVKEAVDGDLLTPGTALVAPGGRQMVAVERAGQFSVSIYDSDPSQIYKPSVDVCFSSVARVFSGDVLAIVLTGMGADGREGATLLKRAGAAVWAQDEQSCVVYGMPHAIVQAGLADRILPLPEIADHMVRGR